jgi:hypothetical protein
MWTPADRALVGDFGSGQALTNDQFRLVEPLIPPAKPGGRPRTTNIRNLLDGLFYLVRTGCQWDRRKVGGQAATAIGGCGSLAGRNFCPKPVPSVPL